MQSQAYLILVSKKQNSIFSKFFHLAFMDLHNISLNITLAMSFLNSNVDICSTTRERGVLNEILSIVLDIRL